MRNLLKAQFISPQIFIA